MEECKMAKITFMGAGNTVFTGNVPGDCMCSEALSDSEIPLYDISRERLEDSDIILNAINKNINNGHAHIKTYPGSESRNRSIHSCL